MESETKTVESTKDLDSRVGDEVVDVSKVAHADFELVERPNRRNLECILHKPPKNTVDPHPQRHELVLADGEALNRKPVQSPLGPIGSEEGGDD